MRRSIIAAITTVAATAAWTLSAGPALAYPPTPPSATTAATELASLTVKTEGSTSGYSRISSHTGSPSPAPVTRAKWC